ncbi:MAG: hypothetical protein IT434_02230 [Phycisphaerales bacterium]|jgi:hypothetical protein|nr:hypothetical protein [Phycisphaerales bacterium]
MADAADIASPTPPPAKRGADRDDRGKPIKPLALPDLVKESIAADDRAARERLANWLGKASRHSKPLRNVGMLRPVPIVLAVLVIGSCIFSSLLVRFIGTAGYFVPYVVLVVAVYVERRVLPKRYLRSAPSLVAEGFCGQCGYSLRELPVQLDSCIVCSECGAAWNQQRVTWAWWNHAEPHWSRTGYIFSKPESARAGRDSLGRIVSIRTLQDLTDLQRDADGERKAAIAAADRVLMLRSRWKRVATAIFMLLIFGVFGATMLTESYQPRFSLAGQWQSFICPSIFWIAGIVLALGILGGSMFTTQREVARELALRGVCPSCTALWPPEERGTDRVVCSACGSTWGLHSRSSSELGSP